MMHPSKQTKTKGEAHMRTDLRMIAAGLIIASCVVSSLHLNILLFSAALVLFALASIGK